MNFDSNYSHSESASPTLVAVIDIGSTSVRMQISEIDVEGNVRNLESFSQAVSLGKDSFVSGVIKKVSIEDCVNVLQIYRRKLVEYDITDDRHIRVIATSAVKEAQNRLAFQDRIFIATGFAIEPFDEAELHRVTYLGITPLFQSFPEVFRGNSVICEVGGGTTELISLSDHDVTYSQTLRLGAIRLRTRLEALRVSPAQAEKLLHEQVGQILRQLPDTVYENLPDRYIAMGSEARFMASELHKTERLEPLVLLDQEALDRFVTEINQHSSDAIATRYHFSLPDAESLGPSLLAHQIIARELNAKQFFVATANLRDGILQEMAHGRAWSDSVQRQVIRSATLVGQKFNVDQLHASHVAMLACELFDQLESIHQLPFKTRGLLEVAALLHEIGLFLNSRSYHKHTAYLIRHSEFFGIASRQRTLVSLIARYHRRATPQPSHDAYSQLSRRDRITISKLAALLRIAKALDASRKQKFQFPSISLQGNRVIISTRHIGDFSLEQLQLKQESRFFEEIFGRRVVLQILRR